MTRATKPKSTRLRVLYYYEGSRWIAQCIDYDLNASGSDLEEAQHNFLFTYFGYLTACAELGLDAPLSRLPKAPKRFLDAYAENGDNEMKKRLPLQAPPQADLPPAYMIDAVATERIARRA